MASSFAVEIDISKFNPEGDLQAFITEVDLELYAGAQDIEREAVSRAPVNLGNLKSSIVVEPKAPNGGLKYEVIAGAKYAPFLEFGTGGNVRVPPGYEQFAMQFKGRTTPPIGIRPRPFMIPAFEMFKDEIIKRIQNIK
jgi:HK97 gp10 family phage protein